MTIILKGKPLSMQGIYRSACRGNFPTVYLTKQGKDIKEYYQLSAKQQWKRKPIVCACKLKVKLFFGDKRKRDIDNHNKLLLDSLEGVVYENDTQITELNITKDYDKDNPRIEVEITEA